MANWGMTVPKWMWELVGFGVWGFLTDSGEGLLSAVWVLLSTKPALAKHLTSREEAFTGLLVFLLTPHPDCVQLKQSCIQQILKAVYLSDGLEIVPVPKVVAWGTFMNSSVLWNIVNNPIPNYCKYIILQGNYFYKHYDLINLELELVATIPCCTGVTLHISSPGKDKKGCFSEICVVK